MDAAPRIIVVMGVSGCGKSTVGKLVAEGLGCEFVEGDEYHSPDNIAKMRSGRPLEDDDRLVWMSALNAKLSDVVLSGGRAVLSCSALKDTYRVVQLNLIRKLMCLICCRGVMRISTKQHFFEIRLDRSSFLNRKWLTNGIPAELVRLIFIKGDFEAIERRMEEREGHYMKVVNDRDRYGHWPKAFVELSIFIGRF